MNLLEELKQELSRSVLINWVYPIFLIVVVGSLIYSNSFQVPFQFDDGYIVFENNRNVQDLGEFFKTAKWYQGRFFGYATFALNYYWHQEKVFGYHLVNLGIHLVNSLLVWRFVLLLLRTPKMEKGKYKKVAGLISLLAGLVFVSHPIQTQGVTYISQRLASMATLFYLTGVCSYIKLRLTLIEKRRRYLLRGCLWGVLLIVCSSLGFFTKETVATLPIMLVGIEFYFFKASMRTRLKLAVLPLVIGLGVMPLIVNKANLIFRIKTTPLGEEIGPVGYLMTQFKVIVRYLQLLLVPLGQSADHYMVASKSLFEFKTLVGLLVLIGVIGLGVWLLRKYRLASFGIAWFFIGLLVESSIMPIEDVMFEHRLYLPMVGFSLWLVVTVYELVQRKVLYWVSIMSFVVLMYSGLTFSRNFVWHSQVSLWTDVADKAPLKARAHINLGAYHHLEGNVNLALEHYEKAIQLGPPKASVYNNVAIIFANDKKIDEAVVFMKRAVELDPHYYGFQTNLAKLLEQKMLIDREETQGTIDLGEVLKIEK